MKELVVISGKGGTGKSSLTLAFASLTQSKVIADCDVDAADLHLVLKPQVRVENDFFGGNKVEIDQDNCKGCGKCEKYCNFQAINNRDGIYTIDPLKCEGCGVCAWFCFHGAVKTEPKVAGKWFISDIDGGILVHAALGVKEDNSGKLVSKVREIAKQEAIKNNKDIIIVDGSPGIGCPVIASITGANLILVVTEPTVSGIHDLQRAAELVQHFGMSCLVCINKYNLNEDQVKVIENFCAKKNIEIVGRVPYDLNFTKAQIAGKSLIDYQEGETVAIIKKMWETIQKKLDGN